MRTGMALSGIGLALAIALPARAATFDLSGDWEIDPSAGMGGVCPSSVPDPGETMSETEATIEQAGDAFVLTITGGYNCEPAWTCELSGSIDGAAYAGGSEGVLDDAGGYLVQTIELTASSANAGFGSVRGDYTLDEESCFWEYEFDLARATPEEDGCATARPGADAGPGLIGLLLALL